jgi:hypothetical protein
MNEKPGIRDVKDKGERFFAMLSLWRIPPL